MLAALAAAFAAIALMSPALRFGFVRDDVDLLLRGSLLRREGTLLPLMVSDFWSGGGGVSGLWRPFTVWTLWLDGRLGNWSAAAFHLSNVLAFSAACAALVLAMSAAGVDVIAALAAGLWFACMPAHVESVAWIVGRTDVWAGLWCLVALALDTRARRSGRAAPGVAPVIAFALALLSKEAAFAAAPALWIAAITAPAGARRPAALRWCAPYAAVLAGWALAHALVTRGVPAAPGLERLPARFWTALAAFPWQARFLWPAAPHGPDWSMAPVTGPTALALAGLALHVGAALALGRLVARRDALAVPLALAWAPFAAIGALVLVRGMPQVAERQMVLASAGVAWLLAAGLARACARARRATQFGVLALGAMLVLASAAATWAALPAWRDNLSMYEAMARVQPANATAPLGQALAWIERGDDARAWAALDRAAALDSTRQELAIYRATVLIHRERAEEALAFARAANARGPWNRDAHLIEGLALQSLERWPESHAVLSDLIARAPGDDDVRAAWTAQLAHEAAAADSAAHARARGR